MRHMKPIVFCLALFVSNTFILSGQDLTTIENPKKPAGKNPGRVLVLKEELRITDDGKNFYFKAPFYEIEAAPDGSIFVQDELKLYKFGPDGRYLGNFIKVGQGPGEITTELTDLSVWNGEVILFSAPSSKIVKLDSKGNFLRDLKFSKKTFYELLDYDGRKYFMIDFKPRDPGRKEGILIYDHHLFIVDSEGNAAATPCTLMTEMTVSYTPGRDGRRGAIMMMSVTRLRRSRIAPPHLYIADTEDYLIKQIDINSGALAKSFKRDYPRLRNPKSEIKEMRMKFPEFENDVQALLVHKNRLWVLTSTFDPKKGILVDVFDEQGKYMDNFFLPLSNVRTGGEFSLRYMPMTIEGNFLYAVEHDKDWNYSVVKYRIGE